MEPTADIKARQKAAGVKAAATRKANAASRAAGQAIAPITRARVNASLTAGRPAEATADQVFAQPIGRDLRDALALIMEAAIRFAAEGDPGADGDYPDKIIDAHSAVEAAMHRLTITPEVETPAEHAARLEDDRIERDAERAAEVIEAAAKPAMRRVGGVEHRQVGNLRVGDMTLAYGRVTKINRDGGGYIIGFDTNTIARLSADVSLVLA
jgi:hypothetical protein